MNPTYRARSDTLENGLRILTVELPHVHQALVSLYVRVGSRHETEATNGVSHFLEHLFFRGSEAFPNSVAMHAAVEDVGGNLNGYTERDHGAYFTPVHPDGVPVAIEVLADMMAAPLLDRKGEIDLERSVILEEMLDEVDGRGRDIDLENLAKRALWGDDPLAYKIAGTPRVVRALDARALRAHHARWYGGNNLVFCAAGPLGHRRVMELCRRHFGRLPAGQRSRARPPPPPKPGPTFRIFDHDESQTEFRLSFIAPPEDTPGFLALGLLRRVLDDGLSSRLPFEIVERRGLCYALHCGVDSFDDVSVLEIEGAASHGKVGRAVAEILQILGRVAREGPTAEELARAKRRHRMALEASLDSTYDMAAWFGGTALFREPPPLERRAEEMDAISAGQVVALAREVLRPENLTVTAVGNPTRLQHARLRATVLEAEGLG